LRFKNKLSTWAFVFLLALSGVVPILGFVAQRHAVADPNAVPIYTKNQGAPIVNLPAYKSISSCYAVVHDPTKLTIKDYLGDANNGFSAGGRLRDGWQNLYGSGDGKSTLQAAFGGKHLVYVTFTSDNTPDRARCLEAGILIQSTGSDKTVFYGFENTGECSPGADQLAGKWNSEDPDNPIMGPDWYSGYCVYVPLAASVIPSNDPFQTTAKNTVTFTYSKYDYPSNSMNNKPSRFDEVMRLQIYGDTAVLGNATYFPPPPSNPGGGTSGSSTCNLSNPGPSNDDLKKCVAASKSSFVFTDVGHVTYQGITFTAVSWGGNTMKYISSAYSGGGTGELDLSTAKPNTSHSIDINMDDKGLQSDLQDIREAIQYATSGKKQVQLTFKNTDAAGNAPQTPVQANTSALNIWAQYLPTQKTVQLLFGGAGGNESPYYGTDGQYAAKSATEYALAGPNVGCATLPPTFTFNSPPSQTRAGGYVTAHWTLPYSHPGSSTDKDTCGVETIDVQVRVMSTEANPIKPVDNGGAGDTSAAESPTCESSGFSLSWIMCPIINGLASAVDGIYSTFIQPLLQTNPIVTTANGDPTNIYKIWSNFRIYGDVFLVIALLVIVFGQSIGGGAIDAYTAKKVLPRLLIAAVLINLSIYIVALLVDITNIVGGGIQTLLTQPFQNAGQFTLKLSGDTSATLAFGGVASLAALVGGIWVLAGAGLAGSLIILGPLIQFVLLFILFPALLTFLAILATVLIRRGLIILLVVVSPVAFALYCLPNTEQYFRKWWDLLFKTLLVYPIIAVVFAIANIMSVTINMGGNGSNFALKWVAQLMSVAALIIPLFLIPFAFRIAGGILGKAHEAISNYNKRGMEAIKGNVNDPNSLRNSTKRKAGASMVRGRSLGVAGLGSYSKNQTGDSLAKRFTRRGAGFLGKQLNYGDLEAKRSALTKEAAERRELKTGYGPDDSVRAFFATKGTDGKWRSMTTGKEFSEVDVAAARRLYGGNESSIQSAIDYELGKAEPEQYEKMVADSAALLSARGFNDDEVGGIMKGVGYKNQGKYLDLKHSKFTKNADGTWSRSIDHAALARNAAVDFGSYPISNMKPAPIEKLAKAHSEAEAALADGDYEKHGFTETRDETGNIKMDKDGDGNDLGLMTAEYNARKTRNDVESTAATLDTAARYGGRSQQGEAEGGVPLSTSGAPGRVDQEIQKLVNQTNASKARRNPPTPPSTGPTPPATPGPSGPTLIQPPRGYTGSQG